MTNPLKHVHEINAFAEAYQVVRTAVVVMDGQTYRIDVLKGYLPAADAYTARCWVQQQVTVPSIAPAVRRKGEDKHGTVTIFVEHPFSSPVEGKSPKSALAEALDSLAAQRPSVRT